MEFNIGALLIWIIVGGLTGSLAGMMVTRKKKGFGHFWNFLLGMAGAVVGGFVFRVFKIDLNLGEFSISFEDLISAFAGSLVVLVLVWGVNRLRRGKM